MMDLSVICPFYNEEGIIEESVRRLLQRMSKLEIQWELIVVDDGSTDSSAAQIEGLCDREPRLRLLRYKPNRGRGHALRTGIESAQGAIIVTTEIDLSWGEDIVQRLVSALEENPHADYVIASPHLPGGGYKNVPRKRVILSWLGNWIIRLCMSNAATMNTGMTRAYRREMIQALPLDEDGKELHLEVVLKANAFKYRGCEIPCVLEWKSYKHQGKRVDRKSSSKVNRLIVSHTLFGLFANPIRYVWGLSAATLVLSVVFLIWGVWLYVIELVAIYTLLIGLTLGIISLMFFALGVIAQQGYMIQRELWEIRHSQRDSTKRARNSDVACPVNDSPVSRVGKSYDVSGTSDIARSTSEDRPDDNS